MPDPDWHPVDQPPKSPFLRKLGFYLTGVAIGFVLLGWFQYKKSVAAQNRRQQLESQQAPRDTPPPAPTETTP